MAGWIRVVTIFMFFPVVAYNHLFLKPARTHTLVLCRHGDSIWNGGEKTPERFTGWTDVPLSKKGMKEAIRTGKVLASYLDSIDLCFTSTLLRSRHTAQIISDSLVHQGWNPLILLEDFRLNERHYGSLQGYVKKDIEEGLHGHKAEDVRMWRRSWNTVPPLLDDHDPRRMEDVKKYSKMCGGHSQVPRGESLQMVARNRISPFVRNVLAPNLVSLEEMNLNKSSTILIVGHANSLRALLGVICNIEGDDSKTQVLEDIRLPTCTPLVIQVKLSQEGSIHPHVSADVENLIPVMTIENYFSFSTQNKEISQDSDASFNKTSNVV